MAGFDCVGNTCAGAPIAQLSVAGFDLTTPAWQFADLTKLWFEHAVRDQEGLVLPTAAGRRSYPDRLDETQHELTVFVNGEVNADGDLYADPWTGIVSNLDALFTNALSPVTTGRGTRPAVLTLPDGVTTRTADVKFTPLRGDDIEDPTFAVFRTTMTIPAGRFT